MLAKRLARRDSMTSLTFEESRCCCFSYATWHESLPPQSDRRMGEQSLKFWAGLSLWMEQSSSPGATSASLAEQRRRRSLLKVRWPGFLRRSTSGWIAPAAASRSHPADSHFLHHEFDEGSDGGEGPSKNGEEIDGA
ncbi:hypothetical protein C4D60_Mb10t09090 [Musa balbisiana]|uniref:Uncharacterized protein n=1 Tax=Musa balbisiana TaxID=52838 RepID=A0A4S8IVQ9_MUSBA|nr:hypothetical protein C4D60_Mb10t09090 [Musa balbisiana]